MLDSSRLINTLRAGEVHGHPRTYRLQSGGAASFRRRRPPLTVVLNPEINSFDRRQPPIVNEWYHTPIKVPDRPYLIVLSESREVQSAAQLGADPNDGLGVVRATAREASSASCSHWRAGDLLELRRRARTDARRPLSRYDRAVRVARAVL